VRDIISLISTVLLIFLAFAAGFYRGEASTMDKRMDTYEQGKRDGYWDAWQKDPESVKPQDNTDTITVHMQMPKAQP
jgi:hypothetical protein